jgi:hypothetical protein
LKLLTFVAVEAAYSLGRPQKVGLPALGQHPNLVPAHRHSIDLQADSAAVVTSIVSRKLFREQTQLLKTITITVNNSVTLYVA